MDFCYRRIPEELDPFDNKAFAENPMKFYVVATDADTGKPVYVRMKDCREKDLEWIRASASLPLVSEIVEYDGKKLLDGGTADSIPVDFMREKGFSKNIVILTRPAGYQKGADRTIPLMKWKYSAYPAYVEAAANREKNYNATLDRLKGYVEDGSAYILQPSRDLGISRTEKDLKKLKRMYKLGRFDARNHMEEIKAYVEG